MHGRLIMVETSGKRTIIKPDGSTKGWSTRKVCQIPDLLCGRGRPWCFTAKESDNGRLIIPCGAGFADMSNFFHDFVLTFLPLFIVVDALGNVPIIITLSEECPASSATISLISEWPLPQLSVWSSSFREMAAERHGHIAGGVYHRGRTDPAWYFP